MRALVVAAVLAPTLASAHPDRCAQEVIVGRPGCRQFGDDWSTSPGMLSVFVDMGMTARRTTFPAAPAIDPASAAVIAPGSERRINTLGTEMRFGVDIPSIGLMVGAHLDAGIGSTDGLLSTGAVLGMRTTRGRLTLAAEVIGGARFYLLTAFESEAHEQAYLDMQTKALVEGRGRVELWLAPWISANVWVGASALDRSDVSTGISLSVVTRPFRGR